MADAFAEPRLLVEVARPTPIALRKATYECFFDQFWLNRSLFSILLVALILSKPLKPIIESTSSFSFYSSWLPLWALAWRARILLEDWLPVCFFCSSTIR